MIIKSLFISLLFSTACFSAQIGVIGAGYVGLILTAILGECNHSVICMDIDQKKIDSLNTAKVPIHEPGLENALFHSPFSKNLQFTTDFLSAIQCPIIYLCVETPRDEQGRCDCSAIYKLLNNLSIHARGPRLICVKSTVSPGSIADFTTHLRPDMEILYNPEFLREGSALKDIHETNPLIIGSTSPQTAERIKELYAPLLQKNPNLKTISTSPETAELIKYGWNGFSALRITYMNELSQLCRAFSADVFTVIEGIALSEELLPTSKIRPGPGFGGSCLPKDTQGIAMCFEEHGLQSSLIHQTIASNQTHISDLIRRTLELLKNMPEPKNVSILGLSYKANTDDIRHSPALLIIENLLEQAIQIKAYDPLAARKVKALFPSVQIFDSPYDAVRETDCVLILSDASEIQNLFLEELASQMRHKKLIDTRNVYDPLKLQLLGFEYINAGRMN